MSSNAGFAILGAGLFPGMAYLPALAALRSSGSSPSLKAIYSRSEKSATELAGSATKSLGVHPDIYFDQPQSAGKDLDALLARSDIKAVIIALPITVQPDVVLRALKAGKHVLSEKPVAANVKAGLELIKEAAPYVAKGLVWRVAENFEVEPVYAKVRQLIAEGKIGEVKAFRASVKVYLDQTSEWYNTPWRTKPEYQGGFLLDGGVHTSAALRTMLPNFTSSQLISFASLNKEYLAPHDTFHAIVKNASYSGTLDFTWAWPTRSHPNSDETVIMGSTGYMGIARRKVEEGGGWKVSVNALASPASQEYKEIADTYEFRSSGVAEEFKSFFDVALGGGKEDGLVGNPTNALFDVALIQGALESNGGVVDLGQLWVEG
ncbi:hypothetical protein V5O48_001477 [Marasmius crinis-equi]|uniref:Oxidoreductase n=1 Tax=Marasmius crinis-equi TaxID=585013 RepID=A0ABR3FYN1_9AGAR